MGNWCSVQVVGKCDPKDVPALSKALQFNKDTYEDFHCLSTSSGVCGLQDWAKPEFNTVGNLAERGYDASSVEERLQIIAKTVPSLSCKIHCGGDHEGKKCVATVTCEGGVVTLGPPEIKTIPETSGADMMKNLFQQLRAPNRH